MRLLVRIHLFPVAVVQNVLFRSTEDITNTGILSVHAADKVDVMPLIQLFRNRRCFVATERIWPVTLPFPDPCGKRDEA